MKKDDVYLRHMLDAMVQIERYLTGVSIDRFFADPLIQDAVVRRLEIIGEASRSLSDSFRQQNTQIPWRAIIGMRNRMIHDYLNVDVQVVWEVTQHDLPMLKEQVIALLEKPNT